MRGCCRSLSLSFSSLHDFFFHIFCLFIWMYSAHELTIAIKQTIVVRVEHPREEEGKVKLIEMEKFSHFLFYFILQLNAQDAFLFIYFDGNRRKNGKDEKEPPRRDHKLKLWQRYFITSVTNKMFLLFFFGELKVKVNKIAAQGYSYQNDIEHDAKLTNVCWCRLDIWRSFFFLGFRLKHACCCVSNYNPRKVHVYEQENASSSYHAFLSASFLFAALFQRQRHLWSFPNACLVDEFVFRSHSLIHRRST